MEETQNQENFINRNSGCLRDRVDLRDYKVEDIMIFGAEAPDFTRGYDVEQKYGVLKYENQMVSFSCVGQAWAYYAEMLNLIETGEFTNLSARDVYSQIAIYGVGAYLRDGGKILTRKGITEEK